MSTRKLSPEDVHLRAMLAESAYQRPAQRPNYFKKHDLERYGYIYDGDLSNEHNAVYFNPKDKKVITAFRGTQLHHGTKTAVEDLSTDGLIVLGMENFSTRFKDTKDHHQKVMDHYKDYQHETVGHSLGGSLSNYVGRAHGVESHSFNPGSTKSVSSHMKDHVRRQIDPKFREDYDRHHVYLSGFDPISVSEALGGNVHYYKVKDLNERNRNAITPSHSVDAFTLQYEK